MNGVALWSVKAAAVSCLGVAVAAALAALSLARDSGLRRAYFRYEAELGRQLRLLFSRVRAEHIVRGQLCTLGLVVLVTLLTGKPAVLGLLLVVALAPKLLLAHLQRQRVASIEHKLDSFVVALANALRASPSAGRALAMIAPVTPAPLDREIALVLREMRVGSTLEQALGNLSARVRSFPLDAALSGLLIGRQTGGNVPAILDGAAQTLREIARLQGVLRSKTAEARAQAHVLLAAPAVIIFAFDLASPGYFRPLTESLPGVTIMVLATVAWIGSVLMLRRIMAVQL